MATYRKYELFNTQTNSLEKTPLFTVEELEKYLSKNNHLNWPENKGSSLPCPGLHSGRPLSVYKTDGAYREKLSELKKFYPGNSINV